MKFFKSKFGWLVAVLYFILISVVQWGCNGFWGSGFDLRCFQILGQFWYYMANDYLIAPGLILTYMPYLITANIFGVDFHYGEHHIGELLLVCLAIFVNVILVYVLYVVLARFIRFILNKISSL